MGCDKEIKIHFKFQYGNQYIAKGEKFLFREGRTRGSGYIYDIIEYKTD